MVKKVSTYLGFVLLGFVQFLGGQNIHSVLKSDGTFGAVNANEPSIAFFKNQSEELHTPIPDSFLDGITRRTVIEIAKSKNIKVHERKINPDELKDFTGCFLTGTAAEVTPVSSIAENKFKVCEMIIDLNESYQALVKKKKAA